MIANYNFMVVNCIHFLTSFISIYTQFSLHYMWYLKVKHCFIEQNSTFMAHFLVICIGPPHFYSELVPSALEGWGQFLWSLTQMPPPLWDFLTLWGKIGHSLLCIPRELFSFITLSCLHSYCPHQKTVLVPCM